jgi:hypothetical protein
MKQEKDSTIRKKPCGTHYNNQWNNKSWFYFFSTKVKQEQGNCNCGYIPYLARRLWSAG